MPKKLLRAATFVVIAAFVVAGVIWFDVGLLQILVWIGVKP